MVSFKITFRFCKRENSQDQRRPLKKTFLLHFDQLKNSQFKHFCFCFQPDKIDGLAEGVDDRDSS